MNGLEHNSNVEIRGRLPGGSQLYQQNIANLNQIQDNFTKEPCTVKKDATVKKGKPKKFSKETINSKI